MNLKQYAILKAATNVISGMSMVTLICLGVAYLSFKNAFVFNDTHINIVNNPVGQGRDIEFYMVGSKKHECNSTRVYGVAYAEDGHMHQLNTFSKRYIQNTAPGERVENGWHMRVPKDMVDAGEYRVSMTGDFVCNYLIFTQEKSQTFDNILLIVEPRTK
jgi:hypothetical protein